MKGHADGACIGNRSSYDDSKSDGPEDETTVVEPDQGNGEDIFPRAAGSMADGENV